MRVLPRIVAALRVVPTPAVSVPAFAPVERSASKPTPKMGHPARDTVTLIGYTAPGKYCQLASVGAEMVMEPPVAFKAFPTCQPLVLHVVSPGEPVRPAIPLSLLIIETPTIRVETAKKIPVNLVRLIFIFSFLQISQFDSA